MRILTTGIAALVAAAALADASAIAPKALTANGAKFVCDPGITVTPDGDGWKVESAPNGGEWAGFSVTPASGTWDLSAWGHFEVTVKSMDGQDYYLGLRVDNPGDWTKSPWNSENLGVKANETKIGRVIFGYQYGFKKGYKLDPSKVSQVKLFFNGKSSKTRTIRVSNIFAAGPAREKPPVDPNSVVRRPVNNVILPSKEFRDVNYAATGGAQAKLGADGMLAVEVGGDAKGGVVLKPESGWWSFNEGLKLAVTVKNCGTTAFEPTVRIESSGQAISGTGAAVKPGATGKVEVSFMPKKPWFAKGGAYCNAEPGHEWKFESHRVRKVVVAAGRANAKFVVSGARIEKVIAQPPSWLGKRPPVEGKWRETFRDEFNGKQIDETKWNIYAANYWDQATHFTKDNIFIRDGKLVLKYEKKRGRHNDDPKGKETDYACGFADTYGKWTQRYGYFETRVKLPRCPGLWPAFWMMPDRGADKGEQWVRAATENGGMEFDIMEHLTSWGPYRFNVAWHWDGYGKNHKSVGSTWIYMPADKEGYITVGLLWLPGTASIWGNGVELARWENARVGDQLSNFLIDVVQGGWANDPLDEDMLPDELVLDYVRVWQRADLMAK